MSYRKKRVRLVLVFMVMLFAFAPLRASAAEQKRLDEALGEYALSIVGKDKERVSGYAEVARELGKNIISQFKDRDVNGLNEIVGGVLDSNGQLPVWDELIDWAFPVGTQGVAIKATAELKGAIAKSVNDMPETIHVGDGMTFLGVYSNEKRPSPSIYYTDSIKIPFQMDFLAGSEPEKIYFRFEATGSKAMQKNPRVYYYYDSGSEIKGPERDFVLYTSMTEDGKMLSGYFDYAYRDKLKDVVAIDRLEVLLETSFATKPSTVSVYYSLGEPIASEEVAVSNFISNNYLNNSSNDNYHIINGQVGDNTTVYHNFNNTYNNFNDYGLTPDKTVGTPEQGILGKLAEFLSGIGELIEKFWDGVFNIIERVVGLFIPTSEQIAEMGRSVSGITDVFKGKFSGAIQMGESVKSVFASPKSLADVTYTIQGQTVHLIPSYFVPYLAEVRKLLSGFAVIWTFIGIYRRFVGSGDVIKE